MHISWYNTSISRMWTDLGKPRYTVNRVPMTKNSLQVPLVALNYSVEYFHGKYWPVSGVQMNGELREWRAERK